MHSSWTTWRHDSIKCSSAFATLFWHMKQSRFVQSGKTSSVHPLQASTINVLEVQVLPIVIVLDPAVKPELAQVNRPQQRASGRSVCYQVSADAHQPPSRGRWRSASNRRADSDGCQNLQRLSSRHSGGAQVLGRSDWRRSRNPASRQGLSLAPGWREKLNKEVGDCTIWVTKPREVKGALRTAAINRSIAGQRCFWDSVAGCYDMILVEARQAYL